MITNFSLEWGMSKRIRCVVTFWDLWQTHSTKFLRLKCSHDSYSNIESWKEDSIPKITLTTRISFLVSLNEWKEWFVPSNQPFHVPVTSDPSSWRNRKNSPIDIEGQMKVPTVCAEVTSVGTCRVEGVSKSNQQYSRSQNFSWISNFWFILDDLDPLK